MQKYEIETWHSVILNGNTIPYPMIYINYDQKLIDYAKENDYRLFVTIQDTNSLYDNKLFLAIIDHSGYFPNYRPNFFMWCLELESGVVLYR